jgi:hypothetical protein
MNVLPTPAPTYPIQEAPRPLQQTAQETSRPVAPPTQTDAMLQEARRDQERRIQRDSERHADNQRASASMRGETDIAQPTDTGPRSRSDAEHPEPAKGMLGAVLDVFA